MASITVWTRLEPRSREPLRAPGGEGDPPDPLARGLEARFRDPAWALARQWQVGELRGEDAGSPIEAAVRAEQLPLTSWRPGAAGAPAPLEPGDLLEPLVEAEPVKLGLRGSLQLGLRFEEMLAEAGLDGAVPAFQAEYPLNAEPPQREVADVTGGRLRLLAAGRATDGAELLRAARSADSLEDLPPLPSLAEADPAAGVAGAEVVERFMGFCDAVYPRPAPERSWAPRRLGYEFALAAEDGDGEAVLSAPDYGGPRVEWSSFTLGGPELGEHAAAATSVEDWSLLPSPVSFHGMPSSRWWALEDGRTDFGRIEVRTVDIARLLVMEFALIGGDDWFALPVPAAAGSLSRMVTLVVTDTFGDRTLVRPTERQAAPPERPWSMFRVSGGEARSEFLFVPPALGRPEEGDDLEEVLFTRDEMAAIGWAVEVKLQGPLDQAVDGHESYLARLAASPPPPPREREPGGPEIEYVLGTTVPDNWIPLVPVRAADGAVTLRRGLMQVPIEESDDVEDVHVRLEDVHARGEILEPWDEEGAAHPFYVDDEAVSRSGVRVSRRFRRARSADGRTWLWLARRVRPGRGEAASGLEWDAVRPLRPEAGDG